MKFSPLILPSNPIYLLIYCPAQISGFVASLRNAHLALKRTSALGWQWSMSLEEKDNIRFTECSKQSASVPVQVDIPLRALIAEDQKYLKTLVKN